MLLTFSTKHCIFIEQKSENFPLFILYIILFYNLIRQHTIMFSVASQQGIRCIAKEFVHTVKLQKASITASYNYICTGPHYLLESERK